MSDFSANVARGVLYGIARCGVDIAPILSTLEIDLEQLAVPDARISYDKLMAVWEMGAAQIDDSHLGLHAAAQIENPKFGAIGMAFATSRTLKAALETLIRYNRVINSAVEYELAVRHETARFTFRQRTPPYIIPHHHAEFVVAAVRQTVLASAGHEVGKLEIGLQHAAPADTTEYERAFGTVPQFGRPHNEIILDSALLDRPHGGERSATQNQQYEAHARQILDQLPPADQFIADLRWAIFDSLTSGEVAMASIARKLDLEVVELRRALSAHGLSFRDSLTTIRRGLAEIYLQDPSWAITDVAFVLGYSDGTAFRRAFRRWTGKSPAEYRHAFLES